MQLSGHARVLGWMRGNSMYALKIPVGANRNRDRNYRELAIKKCASLGNGPAQFRIGLDLHIFSDGFGM
jgi:hypothetical protein